MPVPVYDEWDMSEHEDISDAESLSVRCFSMLLASQKHARSRSLVPREREPPGFCSALEVHRVILTYGPPGTASLPRTDTSKHLDKAEIFSVSVLRCARP